MNLVGVLLGTKVKTLTSDCNDPHAARLLHVVTGPQNLKMPMHIHLVHTSRIGCYAFLAPGRRDCTRTLDVIVPSLLFHMLAVVKLVKEDGKLLVFKTTKANQSGTVSASSSSSVSRLFCHVPDMAALQTV